jgi:hypothetical protein
MELVLPDQFSYMLEDLLEVHKLYSQGRVFLFYFVSMCRLSSRDIGGSFQKFVLTGYIFLEDQ